MFSDISWIRSTSIASSSNLEESKKHSMWHGEGGIAIKNDKSIITAKETSPPNSSNASANPGKHGPHKKNDEAFFADYIDEE